MRTRFLTMALTAGLTLAGAAPAFAGSSMGGGFWKDSSISADFNQGYGGTHFEIEVKKSASKGNPALMGNWLGLGQKKTQIEYDRSKSKHVKKDVKLFERGDLRGSFNDWVKRTIRHYADGFFSKGQGWLGNGKATANSNNGHGYDYFKKLKKKLTIRGWTDDWSFPYGDVVVDKKAVKIHAWTKGNGHGGNGGNNAHAAPTPTGLAGGLVLIGGLLARRRRKA